MLQFDIQFDTEETPEKSKNDSKNNKGNKILYIISVILILLIIFLFYKIYIYIETLKKEINRLTKENNRLTKENNSLTKEIKELKKKYIKTNDSVIMKENDFELINFALKSRMNKNVKELRKLYQASIDGDGLINFHSRCDNISNTLVLIQSKGNRRFGGFTSIAWDTSGDSKRDEKSFLFSLDKQKTYSLKSGTRNNILGSSGYGPYFDDIIIKSYPIQEKNLITLESRADTYYNFDGDKEALSESHGNRIYAIDIEVFQVIFE